jgi:hypothetical protein
VRRYLIDAGWQYPANQGMILGQIVLDMIPLIADHTLGADFLLWLFRCPYNVLVFTNDLV